MTRRWRRATPRRPITSRPRPIPSSPTLNNDYAHVKAPFDGIVTARQVSVGEYRRRHRDADPACHHRAGRSDLRELQHQRTGRAAAARRDRAPRPDARRHQARFRSRSDCRPRPDIRTPALSITPRRPSMRRPARWRRAASLRTPTASCCPAISPACASRSSSRTTRLLVPDAALGSDQGGRYLLVVNKDNVGRASRRRRSVRWSEDLRVIDSGLKAG